MQRYIVCYGTGPDGLYRSRTVLTGTAVELAGLNAETDPWARVDSVNDGDATLGEWSDRVLTQGESG